MNIEQIKGILLSELLKKDSLRRQLKETNRNIRGLLNQLSVHENLAADQSTADGDSGKLPDEPPGVNDDPEP